jgi:D-serine deaminase-like pyridoxal phosphate-dependent protein
MLCAVSAPRDHAFYRAALRGRSLPAAFVDLELFDANARQVLQRAGDRPVRLATKSLRCPALVERLRQLDRRFRGLMAYGPREAAWLLDHGHDDVLLGYPATDPELLRPLAEAARAGRSVTFMVDCRGHVERLGEVAAGATLSLCLDLDVSLSLPGLHFGVRRSPVTTVEQALHVAAAIAAVPGLRLDGLMAYEAQVAGVPDAMPGRPWLGPIVRALKCRSVRLAAARRAAVVAALAERGHRLRFVNAGGTGSLETSAAEDCVSEVTAGSAFFAPTLFDGYRRFRHLPAAGFALEVTRRPAPGLVTCQLGGYVASGAAGPSRLPQPYLPAGARLLEHEGAGEVQTPVRLPSGVDLALGEPVFFRHAKAGELLEHFPSVLLLSEGQVVAEVPSYRGLGLGPA